MRFEFQVTISYERYTVYVTVRYYYNDNNDIFYHRCCLLNKDIHYNKVESPDKYINEEKSAKKAKFLTLIDWYFFRNEVFCLVKRSE